MNRIVAAVLIGLFLIPAAQAQYSAQLSTATPVLKGTSKAGGFLGIYDGAFGLLGQYRYGVGGYSDIGAKLAVIDLKSGSPRGDAGFSAAIDYKYQIMEVRIMDPIDLSLGGALEVVKFNHFSNFVINANAVGSYPILMSNGRNLTPYGRLLLGIERPHLKGTRAETDFKLSLNMGVTYDLSSSTEALAEIQIDSEYAAFLIGISFGF